MNIGVDMDSVLAEIIRPLDAFHNRKYITNISYEDNIDYSLSVMWHCSEEEVYVRIFEFYNSPEFNTVQPVFGSQKTVKELSKLHNLHIISSRPHSIEDKTKQWISIHFPHTFASIIHTNQVVQKGKGKRVKKSEICKSLKIDLMIDDHIDYALDCADNEIRTLLFEAPWNKNYKVPHPHLKKVASWDEVWYTISHESQKPH